MPPPNTRHQIIAAADQLFYQRGFEHTSFAQIASEVKISRGNFYHHFKSKDEILNAVIEARKARTQAMLWDWERHAPSPRERIKCYINIVLQNWPAIKESGCPVGTLSTELAKLNHASQAGANSIFTLFRTWLAQQFSELGQEQEADALAMHVLAWSQGVATLCNAFQDKQFAQREVNKLCLWLDSVCPDGEPST